jgi:hypothetical protein
MSQQTLLTGTVHTIPNDIHSAISKDKEALEKWNNLTPLGRNEWICWVTFVKKVETREEHVKRLVRELKEGKRRPCCWIGCIHRVDKKISPSVQSILNKRTNRKK